MLIIIHNPEVRRLIARTVYLALYLYLGLSFDIVHCQALPFREYSALDGLPQSQIISLKQDSRNFLWISTNNGISRFDGIDFVNYFRKDGLPSNRIIDIFEDSTGNIWALSNKGLSRYTGYGFMTYPVPGEFEGWSFHLASQVADNRFLLLGISKSDAKRKLVLFNNGEYTFFSHQNPVLDTLSVNEICYNRSTSEAYLLDKTGIIWLLKNKRLTVFSTLKCQHIETDRGIFFATANGKIYRFTGNNYKVYDFSKSTDRFEVDREPKYSGRTLEFFDGRNYYKAALPFNYFSCTIDNSDVLWLLTEGNLYRLLSTAFSVFSDKDIGTLNIWAISEDRNGHMWFGSLYNTLIEYDGKVFRERNEFRNLFRRNIAFYKGSRRMTNGDVWFSTDAGVLIWDGSVFSLLKGIPDNTQICYIYEDADNKIVMVGTEKGLFILKNGNVDIVHDAGEIKLGVVEGIVKDDDGTYWLSGSNGIFRYDGKNLFPVKEEILPQSFTYTIEKDRFGGLWVTSDEGLYFKAKLSKNFVYGLPELINKPANSISAMDENHILIGRTSDICVIDIQRFYNRDKNYFRIYDKTDGFEGSDCLDNGIVKDQQGRFWILTSNNVVILDPVKLKQNPDPPVLNITGFYYKSDSSTWEPVEKSRFFYKLPENLKLSRFQNNLQITFTGISTTNPEKVNYQYFLEGYDDNWSEQSGNRSVVYEKLPPGNYSFNLKAYNADGVGTVHPLVLNFRILPSFWQTKFFLIMMSVLFLIIPVLTVYFILRRRERKREEKARLESEISRLQMSSVLKQFDPHFTFNVISSVGSLIMRGEKEVAYDYIAKLSGLLRTVLSDGSVIIKPLSEELDFVRRYCELQKLRFKGRFNYNIYLDPEVDLNRAIPKMTIQTFVENAIKHGFENRREGGKVDLVLRNNDNYLEIKIIDNGIGRLAASNLKTKGTGYGLRILRSIFDVMNPKNDRNSIIMITDLEENGSASGTEVKILIPDDYRFEFRSYTRKD